MSAQTRPDDHFVLAFGFCLMSGVHCELIPEIRRTVSNYVPLLRVSLFLNEDSLSVLYLEFPASDGKLYIEGN